MQVTVRQAKALLSKLIDQVEEGERVVIMRRGKPIAEIVPVRKQGFPFGCAKDDRLVPAGDDWWRSMSDEEASDWLNGH